jgi:hypothetical protein
MNQDIRIKRPGEALPPLPVGGLRYVLARNGLFLERRTRLFATCTEVDRYPVGLDEHTESCRLHFGRLPRRMCRIMLGFFRRAYAMHGGEAVLLLLYHPEHRRFRWYCPRQTIEKRQDYYGGWYTDYDIRYDEPDALPPGWVLAGDAHSHAWMPAYASYTDVAEERYKDGLHVVAGRIDRAEAELSVEFVMDQKRFRVAVEDVFSGCDLRRSGRFPAAWEERIRIERVAYGAWMTGGGASWR